MSDSSGTCSKFVPASLRELYWLPPVDASRHYLTSRMNWANAQPRVHAEGLASRRDSTPVVESSGRNESERPGLSSGYVPANRRGQRPRRAILSRMVPLRRGSALFGWCSHMRKSHCNLPSGASKPTCYRQLRTTGNGIDWRQQRTGTLSPT